MGVRLRATVLAANIILFRFPRPRLQEMFVGEEGFEETCDESNSVGTVGIKIGNEMGKVEVPVDEGVGLKDCHAKCTAVT